MIDPEEFYKYDSPDANSKHRMWRTIENEIKPIRIHSGYFFDRRSFAMGMGAALIIIFAAIGVYTVINQLVYINTPTNLKLNSAYLSAIKQIETTMPRGNNITGSVEVDEYIAIQKEELKEIDEAINSFHDEYPEHDYSKIKQERLRQLYKLKLDVLEKIIEMEGNK